jgi:hypothetical protein
MPGTPKVFYSTADFITEATNIYKQDQLRRGFDDPPTQISVECFIKILVREIESLNSKLLDRTEVQIAGDAATACAALLSALRGDQP